MDDLFPETMLLIDNQGGLTLLNYFLWGLREI